MRVVILCMGSRGDVQPHIALGEGLRRAGHEVRLATHPLFKEMVTAHGLEFAPLNVDPQEMLLGTAGQTWVAAGRNPIRSMRRFLALTRPLIEQAISDSWKASEGAEAIIFSMFTFPGYNIAEKLRIPCFASGLQPFRRTRAFPAMSTKPPALKCCNWMTHLMAEQIVWQPFRNIANQWRKESLKLPPLSFTGPFPRLLRQRLPHLYGYSQSVMPKPFDWPDSVHVTGYWFMDRRAGWQPPERLVDFLEAGPPPVYAGFGSMIDDDPAAKTDLVLEALALTGHRGVLATGWGGLGRRRLPDSVFQLDSVPHDWLFPRVVAAVHHGGAGTTAAALRAGVPSVTTPFLTTPFFCDQPFWGERLRKLGAGTQPVPIKRLTAESLAEAIHTASTDAGIRARAAALGKRIGAEDGVARAVEAFEHHLVHTDWERVWSIR